MSNQITTAMIRAYRDGIMLDAQQMFSRLRSRVRVESIRGEQYFWDKVGTTGMTKRASRHQDTVITETPHSRRMVTTDTFDVADFIDKRDLIRILNDPASAYGQAMAAAAGRQIDTTLVENFYATAKTGKNGTEDVLFPTATHEVAVVAGGLTTGQVLSAKQILDEAEVNPAIRRHAIVSAQQLTDVLSETGDKIVSSDYNTVKALVQGDISTWVGFDWERSELLQTKAEGSGASSGAAGDRSCPFYSEDAMLLAIGQDVTAAVETRTDKNGATQIRLTMDIGAARDNEDGVVRVVCNE